MNYIQKIDKIISYVLSAAKFSKEEIKEFIPQLQSKYLYNCLIEIDKLYKDNPDKKPNIKEVKTKEDFQKLFEEILEGLGKEKVAEIFATQAKKLLEDIKDIVSEIKNPKFIQAYNKFVLKTFEQEQ